MFAKFLTARQGVLPQTVQKYGKAKQRSMTVKEILR
ncbi:Hypothetical protein AJF4211_000880 [Avibacterium paragallinarum JF4211]|uniref:Uncharacterized protein n=1 Tax=Avibacterium paragallinarum TaxID=728 RepID=A0A380X309_AVIPA|nr:Hypothetical protein AJF4211_000880 [Avibacterium paragallinarum JF4211]STO71206.1 Uncharacterised protein [Avibacterium paragallinarum]SUU97631.1 Uncharacterised protein [Avibacterium paragallinarum]